MSDFLENLSPKDKLIFFGGGALVIFFLVKTLTGSKTTASAVPDQADAAVQTANGAANAEQAFEASVTDQLKAMSADQADAQAKTSQGIADMFTAFQQTQGSALSTLGATIQNNVTSQIQSSQAATLSDVQSLLNQMGRTPVYTTSGGGGGVQPLSAPSSTAGMVSNRSTSQAPGYAVPVMTSTPHVTTQADLAGVVGVSTSQQGYGLVTVKTATGTSSVLAGSVFDPTSPNFKPGSNG